MELLESLFEKDEWIDVRMFNGNESENQPHWWNLANLKARWEWLLKQSEEGLYDVYFGICPRPGKGQGKQADIRKVRALWADMDFKEYDEIKTPQAALDHVNKCGLLKPSYTVFTGHGVHLYWLLDETIDVSTYGLDKIKAILKGIANTLHSDTSVTDLSRVFRIPGTWNRKDQRKGKEPIKCEVFEQNEGIHSISDFEPLAIAIPAAPAKATELTGITAGTGSHGDRLEAARVYLANCEPAIQGEHGDQHTFNVAGHLLAFDLSVDDVHAIMLDSEWNTKCQPPWDSSELMAKVKSAATNGTPREPKEVNKLFDVYEVIEEWKQEAKPETQAKPETPKAADSKPKKDRPDKPIMKRSHLRDIPPMQWLVDRIIPDSSLGVIFGEPMAKKTFLAIDLAASLATGKPFLDHFTVKRKAKVLYLFCEGIHGANARFTAWEKDRDTTIDDNMLAISKHGYQLPDEMGDLLKDIEEYCGNDKPEFIILDTLANNYAGDENSTKDMKNWVNPLTAMIQKHGVSFVVIHHAGHDIAKGMRGSTVLRGACDWAISLSEDGECKVYKLKDGEIPKPWQLTWKKIDTAFGETSLALSYGSEINRASGDEDTMDQILSVVKHTADCKMNVIIGCMSKEGVGKNACYEYVKKLEMKGFIKRLGKSLILITDKGEERLYPTTPTETKPESKPITADLKIKAKVIEDEVPSDADFLAELKALPSA